VEAIGLLAVPVAAFLFARLPGGGLALARPVGLLLAAYPAWLLASLHMVRYTHATAWLGVAALGVLGGFLCFRQRSGWAAATDRREQLQLWLVGELLFTLAFLGWILLRSYVPDVWQTEKPMDMAFINAINRSPWFPPHDPWLSGAPLNYYYFGHYLVAFLIRLSGAQPAVGFNLGVALFFALSLTSVFAVASTLYLAARRHADAPGTPAFVAGLIAAGFAMVLGNLAGAVQLILTPGPLASFDWWSPSRVIAFTANEFPFFSFLLGDLHAHVMAAPFALTTLAFALEVALGGTRGLRPFPVGLAELLLAALLAGSLIAMNVLDYPTQVAILLLCLLLWMTRSGSTARWLPNLAWAGLWIGASLLLFLPYLLHFSAPSTGLGLVSRHASLSQFLHDTVLIYGLAIWVLGTAFVYRLGREGWPRRYVAWNGIFAIVLLVLLAPARLSGLVLVATAVVYAGSVTWRRSGSQPYRFLWLTIAMGIVLAFVGEVLYVRDAFAGTPFYRFNTVFKFGYQAWFLLAVAAGVAVPWSRAWMRPSTRPLWWAAAGALIVAAAAYPVAGSYSREAAFATRPSLDGVRWLAGHAPDDVRAIGWLQTQVGGAPVILEAVGQDFDPVGHARVSTYTGLPTVLGWAGHEIQWGHGAGGSRAADVRTIYSTTDTEEARSLLARYGVQYVFVGSLERADYPPAGLDKFTQLGTAVFASEGATVYRITG
jgi:YYY domain-containing protein